MAIGETAQQKIGGQSLVEILIALSVLVAGVITVGFLAVDAGLAVRRGPEEAKAVFLAREGVAAARSLRDADFDNLTPGSHGLILSGGTWMFMGTQDVQDGYTRTVAVSDIDVDTKQVDVAVSWQFTESRQGAIAFTERFTDWNQSHGQGGNLRADILAVALTSGGRYLRNMTVENVASAAITIDKVTIWWDGTNLLRWIRIGGASVYGPAVGVSSGTEVDIANVTLLAGSGPTEIDWEMFGGSMAGSDFLVLFTMLDSSTHYVYIEQPTSAPDTTPPTVTITSPTSYPSYATAGAQITLQGTASDNVGVSQISWENDQGGSGIASGTTGWTIPGILLQLGANTIIVIAEDAAGNVETDTIAITRTSGPPQGDYLNVNIAGAYVGGGGFKELRGITIENTATTGITIDTITVSWTNARLIERIEIDGTVVWDWQTTGAPSGKQASGAVLDIADVALASGSGIKNINRLTFSGNMSGESFVLAFTMSDGSVKSTGSFSP